MLYPFPNLPHAAPRKQANAELHEIEESILYLAKELGIFRFATNETLTEASRRINELRETNAELQKELATLKADADMARNTSHALTQRIAQVEAERVSAKYGVRIEDGKITGVDRKVTHIDARMPKFTVASTISEQVRPAKVDDYGMITTSDGDVKSPEPTVLANDFPVRDNPEGVSNLEADIKAIEHFGKEFQRCLETVVSHRKDRSFNSDLARAFSLIAQAIGVAKTGVRKP